VRSSRGKLLGGRVERDVGSLSLGDEKRFGWHGKRELEVKREKEGGRKEWRRGKKGEGNESGRASLGFRLVAGCSLL